jgi:hypothetical protein
MLAATNQSGIRARANLEETTGGGANCLEPDTVFRLDAAAVGQSGSDPAFLRNTAERVYLIEAAHNRRSSVQIPPPATIERPRKRGPSRGQVTGRHHLTHAQLEGFQRRGGGR